MWQNIRKRKGLPKQFCEICNAENIGDDSKCIKCGAKLKKKNKWFDTIKEAGAISTATPGFIPRPRYRKKKDDDKDNE